MPIAGCEREEAGGGILDGLPGDPGAGPRLRRTGRLRVFYLRAFVVARAVNSAIFASGQAALDVSLAAYNAIMLVTSGWAAAKGTASTRAGKSRQARLWLFLAVALGDSFVSIKLVGGLCTLG